ncbi:hypothetical protein EDC04DRAFT_2908091 [Pisolithus marmoratus]|nr:hypothetical protein EDC04DRAFT_2908091 [Pisolithus marmoratus]
MIPLNPHICSKSKCTREIPPDDPKKTCSKCREADRLSKARKRKREEEPNHVGPTPPQFRPGSAPGNGPSILELPDESEVGEEQYETAQSLFMSLREIAQKSSGIKFHGTYTIPVDPMMSEKDHVQSAALEVWRTTGYRFRVLHHYPLQTGHKTLYCCCQDEDKKQKSQPSQKEGVKHHDTVGMKRFSCTSSLTVSCCYRQGNRVGQQTVSVKIRHLKAHIPYYDVMMPPDAIQIIHDDLEWSAPSALVPKIRALYPHLTASQVHFAWTRMSEILWKKDTNQLTSAQLLLEECHDIEVLDVTALDGIEQLCWGMTAIAHWLAGKVVEIALDATSLRASHEFTFIDVNFRPPGTPDPTEFEGGVLLEADKVPYDDNIVPSLSIRIPGLSQITAVPPSKSAPIRDATGTNKPLMIKIKLPTGHPDDKSVPAQSQVFCPTHLCDVIVQMVEQHFCAHPLIPGYCYPSPAGIRQWAVKQMYKFCEENDLPELWAYMWENWYRRGRWELWARAAAPDEIPRLKTTMVMESHWRHVKVDYLYHFSKPRVDLLVWILVTKLMPTYHNKLDHLLSDTGRFCELSSWRKKEIQKRMAMGIYDIYYTTTEPKIPPRYPQVVQAMHPVSSTFFLEVQRNRTTPFWSHPTLVPLDGSFSPLESSQLEREVARRGSIGEREMSEGEEDEEPDGNMVDTAAVVKTDQRTFKECFSHLIANLRDFTSGLEYQIQFGDHRMLNTVEHEGASFIRLMENCLDRERRENSSHVRSPTTWDKTMANTMFYRSRPAVTEHGT